MTELYEQHLKYWTKTPPSEVGLRVAALLHEWQGLHHFDERAMKKVDWSNPLYIELTLDHGMSCGQLSTYDFSGLTTLVFLAHDHCIRVDVKPCNGRCFKVMFHPRERGGTVCRRHPALEEAVAAWRKSHQDHHSSNEPAEQVAG